MMTCYTVYTKTPRFPYILLPTQEVRVYLVAMITFRHAPVCKHRTCARLLYHVCDHSMFSIYSTTAHLCGAPLIFAYGAGLPQVIGPRKGHASERINQDLREITLVHYQTKRHL